MSKRISSAGKIVVCEDPAEIVAETQQIEARIRERAYEISLNRGRGGEMENWLSAESEVISVPPVELAEREDAFVVKIPAAGVDPNDIQVLTTSDQILVKSHTPHHHAEEAAVIHFCEFKSAPLFRCLKFPEAVDAKSLKVQSQNGVLQIVAVKAAHAAQTNGSAPVRSRRSPSRAKPAREAG